MDGIINVLKPPGMTSHDTVNWFRRRLGIRRIGHLGTLDPAAAGVLPICVNYATRLAEYMAGADKEYRAEMILGVETDSHDTSGSIKRFRPNENISPEDIVRTMQGLMGARKQVPPMVSAVKHKGRRLYRLAREGKVVEPAPRDITIYDLKIQRVFCSRGFYRATFDVRVSKGTYIRTICHEVGQELGCGGALAFLVRTRVGPFDLSQAWRLEEIERQLSGGFYGFMLPSDFGISDWPAWSINEAGVSRVQNGGELRTPHLIQGEELDDGVLVRLLDPTGRLVAVGQAAKRGGELICQPRKVFI